MSRRLTTSLAPGPSPNVLIGTAFVIGILAAAIPGRASAENPTDSARSAACCDDSLLARLLNWPEADKKKDEPGGDNENGSDSAEKEEPLESDRPDFTDSPATVGRGRVQIESGYQFTSGIGGDRTHSAHDLPELLIRYGLAERLELRVAWNPGFVFDRQFDPVAGRTVIDNGGTDMELGFKYALTKQDEWRPETGLVTSITAPTGDALKTSGQVDTFVNYLYNWKLNKKVTLSGSTGGLWTAESGDHFFRLSQSLELGYDVTDKLHVFNEWYAFFRDGAADDRPQQYDDAGIQYLITPNCQLDWRAGVGLNNVSDRFFTGCGITVRR